MNTFTIGKFPLPNQDLISKVLASISVTFLILSLSVASVNAGQKERPRAAGEKDYYVDNTNGSCSDAGLGTSPSTPFCTITQAANVAIAGDSIHVLNGSYAETVKPNFDGAVGSAISFFGSPGVIITGAVGDATNGGGFRLAGKNYIVIDGFTIQDTADHGIVAIGSTHITITNNHIISAGDTTNTRNGIYFKTVTDSLIQGNTTDHNSLDGIRLATGCLNVTISNNIVFGNSAELTRGSEGINLLSSTGNFIVHNTVYANDDSGINLWTSSSSNQVIGNLVYGNGDHGIDNNDSLNNVIVGNTVQGNVTSGINLEGATGSGGATIENNIVVDNGFLQGAPSGAPGNIRVDPNSIAGTTLNYNLYYLSGGLYQIVWGSGGGSNYPTLANFKTANPTLEVSGVEGNPLLVSPAIVATRPASAPYNMAINTGNYHINFGSPAIDSANSDAIGEPSLDIAGNPRVDFLVVSDTGSGVRTYDDRGAYEFQPPACYALTVNSGVNGSTPSASPLKSSQCATNGDFISGDTINLSGAVADSGYQISGWVGTTNDSSLAGSNTVSMPAAAHAAGVLYATTNVAPVITEGTSVGVTMSEDGAPLAFNLTLNATDGNGDTLNWSITTPAGHGTAGASGTGTSKAISYIPVAEYNGSDNFVVQVSDGRGGTDTITVNVTIQPVNDPPVITEGVSVGVTMSEDGSPLSFGLTLHATDVDTAGPSLTWSISGAASHGTAGATGTGLSKAITYTPTSNFNSADSFVVQVSDGSLTDTITVNVTIQAENDAPVCVGVGLTAAEDTSGDAAPSCTDMDGNPMTYAIVAQPGHGTASVVDGLLHYVPSANYSGSDSFTYKANDGTTDSNTATVTVTVTAVNDAPVITEGLSVSVTMSEDGSPTTFSLTLNATDVDTAGTSLTWSISTAAVNGTASASGTGLSKIIGFTPSANYNGSDSFVVQVSDGGLVDTITVNLTINPENDAPVCSTVTFSTSEDTPADANPSCTDVENNPLTYAIVGTPSHGAASIVSGKLHYSPTTNYTGSDSFTYKANDGLLDSSAAAANVTVTPVNDAPIISEGDSTLVTMSEDGSPTAFSLTLHATDIEGATINWTISTQAVNGLANVTGSGISKAINYVPTANYYGSDSIVVQISDGSLTDTILVNVSILSVNDTPVCSGVSLTTAEDTAGDVAPFCSDVDTGTILTYSVVTQPAHGSSSVVGGLLHYVPAVNYNGPDSFTYKANDGLVDSAAALATVSATPVNDAPICVALPLTTAEDTIGEISPSCTDVDGDALGYSIVGAATNGTASVVSGRLRFLPNANYNGGDSFTYKANDTHVDSNIATVTVTITAVNDAPTITQGSSTLVTMSEDGSPTAFSLALNATDVDTAGSSLTWSISTAAVNGTASASGTGLSKIIGFTPAANYNGSDSFVVQVSDGGLVDTITVNLTINPVNDAPTCSSIPLTTDEDTTGETAPFCTDVDGNPLTYSIASGASHGTALVVAGNLRYIPLVNYSGGDSFTYRANDGTVNSSPAVVTVTVDPVNDPPVCSPVSLSTTEDLPGEAVASCTDIEGDTLTLSIVGAASHGIATAGVEKLYYSPAANYNGADTFTYKARDSQVDSNTATATVMVTPVNDSPICSGVSLSTNEDTLGEASPACSDVEGNPLTYSIVGTAAHGTTSVVSGKLRFTPAANYYGPDLFTYKANDSFIDSNISTATVTVLPINDPPVIAEGNIVAINMSENGVPIPFSLTLNATDVEGDNLTWSILSPASHGAASASGTGFSKAIGYIPNTNYMGNDSFTVQVSDINGGLDTIAVNISIIEVTFTISGSTGIGDVELSFFDREAKSVESDSSGFYNLSVNYDWTGEVTPTKEGYSFSPVSRSYTGVRANQVNQDYGAWTPADHSIIEWNKPRFSWPAVPSATGYQFQVSKSNMFSTTLFNTTVTGTGYTPSSFLPVNTLLYWRVKANGVNPSVWSEVWSFTSANPPGVPVLVSPASNALVTDYTPKLDWKDVVAPVGTVFEKYEVQVATDAGFTALVEDEDVTGGVGNSEYTPGSDLDSNTKYYWRVRSYNDDGQYSAWSSVWYFRTAMTPPELSAPANGTVPALKETRPKFEWGEADAGGAVNYTLQVSASASMSSPVVNVTVVPLSYVPVKDLPQGKVLYWRVKANGVNPSAWSEVWSFTSANPPSMPVLVSPVSKALVTDYTPKLDWKDSTVPVGTVFGKYEVQLGKGGVNDSTPKVEAAVSEYTPGSDLDPNASYYWRVRVCNLDEQCSTWSSAWYFRTAMRPPELSAPANEIDPALLTTRPEFRWGVVSGSVNYTLQVSASASMSSPVLTAIVSGTAYTPSSDLPKGKVLYWRVKANGLNPSVWSEVWSFTSANPPGVPVLVSPVSNALVTDYTPKLDWKDVVAPVGTVFEKYEVQVATDAGFTALVEDEDVTGGVGNSEYTPGSDLDSNTKYYWRVRSYNDDGQYSAWSSVWYFRTAMTPPELSAPANGTVPALKETRPKFEWGEADAGGAVNYTLQVSASASMSSPVVNVTVVPLSYVPVKDLPQGKVLYWRVKANGVNPSAWSEVWSFTSANPPSMPVLVSPVSKALVTDYTPKLDWKDSTVPVGTVFGKYEVQLGKGGVNDSTPKVEAAVSEYTPGSDLDPNASYYWRVRVCNLDEQCSTWSSAWYFRTAMRPPELSAPANEIDPALLTTRPEFRWGVVSGSVNYTLQVSASASMSSPVLTAIVSGTAYTPSSDLPKGKVLYWRVKANGLNPSVWSEVWSFTSANPPGVPVLISPVNNTLTTLHKPWLDWKDSTLPTGTSFGKYEFQMATDSSFTSLEIDDDVLGITNSEYTPLEKIDSNMKHYWRVRACNTEEQCSLWSAVWYFRTALDEPELVSPEDTQTISSRRPTFEWEDVPGAASYTIQISSSPTITATVTSSTYIPGVDLPVGTTLYWKVKANGANPSAWADMWSFNIAP